MSTIAEVWIAGASVRAVAESARERVRDLHLTDLFADQDTCAIGDCWQVGDFGSELPGLAERWPRVPLIITGGLENNPDLLAAICAGRPAWCCSPQAIRDVRDPAKLQQRLRAAGLPSLEVRMARHETDARRWLHKPLASAGGAGIRHHDVSTATGTSDTHPDALPGYFQRFQPGRAAAAAWIMTHDQARLLGITRQLVGPRFGGPDEFSYCGSSHPALVPAAVMDQLQTLGQLLQSEFGLRGLVGADFILQADKCFVVEVNPRPTQSMEILDWHHGSDLFDLHWAAFQPPQESADRSTASGLPRLRSAESKLPSEPQAFRIKWIIYAPQAVRIDCDLRDGVGGCEQLVVKDIPQVGQQITAGEPVCTLISTAESGQKALAAIELGRRQLARKLRFPEWPQVAQNRVFLDAAN